MSDKKIVLMVLAVVALVLFAFSYKAEAASVTLVETNAGLVVVFEGPIVVGDSVRLDVAMTQGGTNKVVMSSTGGSAVEGYKIGAVLSDHEATVLVPEGYPCLSACANAFVGAKTHIIHGVVGFHVAWFDEESVAGANEGARMGQYLGALSTVYFINNGFCAELPVMLSLLTSIDTFLIFTNTEEFLKFYARDDTLDGADEVNTFFEPTGLGAEWYVSHLKSAGEIHEIITLQRG